MSRAVADTSAPSLPEPSSGDPPPRLPPLAPPLAPLLGVTSALGARTPKTDAIAAAVLRKEPTSSVP